MLTKVSAHKDLNEAFSILLSLCCLFNAKAATKDLRKLRSFLSAMIDRSELPEV